MLKGRRAKVAAVAPEPISETPAKPTLVTMKALHWDPEYCNFSCELIDPHPQQAVDKVRFYGWYRKSRIAGRSVAIVHCVDIFAKVGNTDLGVDSLSYTEDSDPRDNIDALSSDIVAHCNKWLVMNGNVTTIRKCVEAARRPRIVCKRISEIDALIQHLREVRHTAIQAGGTRFAEFRPNMDMSPITGTLREDADETRILIEVNVSPQAFALEGKVPKIGSTSSLRVDAAMRDGATAQTRIVDMKGRRARTHVATPGASNARTDTPAPSGNIKALLDQLIDARAKGDKPRQREIRKALRAAGHVGGTRGMGGD